MKIISTGITLTLANRDINLNKMGRKDRVKSRARKGVRKRFRGNQHTRINTQQAEQQQQQETDQIINIDQCEHSRVNTPNETASSSKIQHTSANTPKQSDPKITGYRFVDVEISSDMISFLCCPNCKGSGLMLHENFSKKKGFASLLLIKCECGFEKEFYSSQPASAKTHDINRRIIYTMRSIGQGYSLIQKFTALMNMPQPMTQKNYDRSVKIIYEVVQDVAEETMADAATELKENQGTNNPDVSVSCDGKWQRRGFSSLNCSFTAISVDSEKILDTEVMSRYCKRCKGKENLKETD